VTQKKKMQNAIFTEEGYLSPPGKPYQSAELQRKFYGMTLRDIYVMICRRQGCAKANSGVLKLLSDKAGDWEVQSLDLSHNYIGSRGAIPVIELTKLLPKLRVINLADNYLDNKSALHLCKTAAYHPALTQIDVSSNPFTWCAGMSFLELVERNVMISKVGIDFTLLKPKITDAIVARARKNLTEGMAPRRASKPTNHQKTIHIRALKRLYRELVTEEGKVPKRAVVQGLRDYYKLRGLENELKDLPIDVLDDAVRRTQCEGRDGTPEGCIEWECFMLCVLTPLPYDAKTVSNIRHVFQLSDVDGVGFVDAADLKEMITLLHGGDTVGAEGKNTPKKGTPTDQEVQQRLDMLNADNTMTLTWEEFLYIMYSTVPSTVGSTTVLPTATPLPTKGLSYR